MLTDTLARREPECRHRCLVFVDEGVLQADPSLSARIEVYAQHNRQRVELVSAPIPVPGGEKVKVELHFVETMQRRLFEHRIDRHSYVIGVPTVLAQNDSGVGVPPPPAPISFPGGDTSRARPPSLIARR